MFSRGLASVCSSRFLSPAARETKAGAAVVFTGVFATMSPLRGHLPNFTRLRRAQVERPQLTPPCRCRRWQHCGIARHTQSRFFQDFARLRRTQSDLASPLSSKTAPRPACETYPFVHAGWFCKVSSCLWRAKPTPTSYRRRHRVGRTAVVCSLLLHYPVSPSPAHFFQNFPPPAAHHSPSPLAPPTRRDPVNIAADKVPEAFRRQRSIFLLPAARIQGDEDGFCVAPDVWGISAEQDFASSAEQAIFGTLAHLASFRIIANVI